MRVNVASRNPIKIEAVREVLTHSEMFSKYDIVSLKVDSGVSEQPLSLEETVDGAINRAVSVFRNCDYSIGIESGLMSVPRTKTGKMDFCVCAIYDGRQNHLGLSCAFEFPILVIKLIHEEEIDANEACYRLGLSSNPKIGSAERNNRFSNKRKNY